MQQKPDPMADPARQERSALTARWIDTAVRPDLHPPPIQRKGMGEMAEDAPSPSTAGGSGQAMPATVQATMEQAFDTDFSAVRIHQGPQATRVGALAFAQGTDIHFAPGQYDPSSQHGQKLLAHELTHVVQQSRGQVRATRQARGVDINDDTSLEREADAAADAALAGGRVSEPSGASAPAAVHGAQVQGRAVQRQEAPGAQASEGGSAAPPAQDALDALLEALRGAESAAQRQAATTALTTWCRDHLVDRDRLGEFLQSSADSETKTRILGELRAEIARNEFLLGWSFEGGVSAGGANGWENSGTNRGTFPDHYMNEVETYGRESGTYWCTSFAGHTATRLGFESEPGNDETSMFWSGYRLDLWARQGTTNGGTRVTPEGQEVAAEGNGSVLIQGSAWQTLYTTLNTLTQGRPAGQSDEDFTAALQQAVDAFLRDHGVPQAGDMFVYDDNNQIHGNSHTNLVERYDKDARTIYTIGGNEGGAVGGRRIVLTDPEQVRRLASMVRIGAEFYTGLTGAGAAGQASAPAEQAGAAAEQAGAPAAAPDPGEAARRGTGLVQEARSINERVAAALHGLGYIQGGDANATVLEWQTGSNTSDASTTDQ